MPEDEWYWSFLISRMGRNIFSVIVGTGSYLPTRNIHNRNFLKNNFYDSSGTKFDKANEEIISKFEQITGIVERRYVTDDLVTSDVAFLAAKEALKSAKIDRDSLDYIIVANNFGDVRAGNNRSDFCPSIASRVKQKLGISNPKTIPYDLPFGCPGWIQGMIQADYFLKSGDVKRALVIGAEVLSRVSDPHDRDSMIYADGAGATIIEGIESDQPIGIISHSTRSDTLEHAYMLRMGRSNNPNFNDEELFLKMDGHKLYEYALRTVPKVIKESLDEAKLDIRDIKKVLLHQANAKMDEAMLKRLYRLYRNKDVPEFVMPMTISWLGNSSVATLPTLFDLLLKGELNNYYLKNGDNVVFASVGAGMNINSMVYRMF